MKKLIIVFQILILLSQSVHAGDGTSAFETTQTVEAEARTQQMPKGYSLPVSHLITLNQNFRSESGESVNVKAEVGVFGATFGNDFKQKLWEIESQSKEPIEIILTLDSTMEAAKAYKQRMALVGRKMAIVAIPDDYQKKFLERITAQEAGGFKELWWDTKDKAGKLMHPVKTITDAGKILSSQFVKPNREDLYLVKFSIATTAATTGALIFFVGVDPMLASVMALSRIAIGGTTLAFRRTINNLFRTNIMNDLSVTSTLRQVVTRTFVLGFGLSQAYYGLGTSLSSSYGLTQAQIFSNSITSGVVDTAASIERDRRLSVVASHRMLLYSLLIGTVLSTFSITGNVGPMVLEWGVIQISSLQTVTLTIFSGLFLSYKFFSDSVERTAQKGVNEWLKERYRRVVSYKKLKAERELEDKLESVKRRERMNELLAEVKLRSSQRAPSRVHQPSPVCANLFR